MKVLDPGHTYLLDTLDDATDERGQVLIFVKRNTPPEKYPGNSGAYSGTNLQEVLRACIDRIEYLQQQSEAMDDYASVEEDADCMALLRGAFLILERRAARRHGRELQTKTGYLDRLSYCSVCGHIECEEHDHGTERRVTEQQAGTGCVGGGDAAPQ